MFAKLSTMGQKRNTETKNKEGIRQKRPALKNWQYICKVSKWAWFEDFSTCFYPALSKWYRQSNSFLESPSKAWLKYEKAFHPYRWSDRKWTLSVDWKSLATVSWFSSFSVIASYLRFCCFYSTEATSKIQLL